MHTPRLCCELYLCEIVTSQFQFSPVSFLLSSTIDLNSGANIKRQTSTLSVVQHSYLGLYWTTWMPLVGLPCTYNNNNNDNRAFQSQFPSNLGQARAQHALYVKKLLDELTQLLINCPPEIYFHQLLPPEEKKRIFQLLLSDPCKHSMLQDYKNNNKVLLRHILA